MPSEPDNKMDELLKAYAKKRRAEAGGELHPATRRLLQAEVSKLRSPAAADSPSWLSAFRSFWPRMAVAAVLVVIGGIGTVSLYPPAAVKNEEVFLAKQDSEGLTQDRYVRQERDAAPLRSLAPAIPVPAKPADQLAVALSDSATEPGAATRERQMTPALSAVDDQRAAPAEKSEALAKSAAPAPTPAPATAAPKAGEPVDLGFALAESRVKDAALGKELKMQTVPAGNAQADFIAVDKKQLDELKSEETRSLATALPAPVDPATALPAQNAPAVTQQLNNTAARSYFFQTQPASRPAVTQSTSDPSGAVLARFSVEQEGEVVRVVDGDGSVYEGKVVTDSESALKELEELAASRAAVRQDDSRLRQKAVEQEVRQQQRTTASDYQRSNNEQPTVWNFRASGTNRTLKQPVTIDAVVYNGIAATNVANVAGAAAGQSLNFYRNTPGQPPAPQQSGYAFTLAPAPATGGVALQNILSNSQSLYLNNALRIQGNYRVGTTNQRALDALRDGN